MKKNTIKIPLISCLFVLLCGCNKNENIIPVSTDNAAIDEIVSSDEIIYPDNDEALYDKDAFDSLSDDFHSEIVLYDTDEYKVKYDENSEVFIIQDLSSNNISEIECPYFWKDDEYDLTELDNYPNIIYEESTKILEVIAENEETENNLSLFFKNSDNNITVFDFEVNDYWRNLKYYGKRIRIDEDISKELFDEEVNTVLNRYDMLDCSDEYRIYSECYPETFVELYYNPVNEKYFIFYTADHTSWVDFYYSICPLAEPFEGYLIDDPFEFKSTYGTTGEEYVDELIEDIVYDGNKIISYSSSGICNSNGAKKIYFEEGDEIELLTYEYEYDDNGELTHWIKFQNNLIWGINNCYREYYCDIPGKCTRMSYEVTSGGIFLYYIYENDGIEPDYFIKFYPHAAYLDLLIYK